MPWSKCGSGSVAGGTFAQLQAAAQQRISGGDVHVFETDGTNGYLFTSAGGPAGTIRTAWDAFRAAMARAFGFVPTPGSMNMLEATLSYGD